VNSRLLLLAMIVVTTAGCSGGGMETLLVTSECVFNGPEQMEEGPVRLTLNQEGLGETGAVIVQILDDRTYQELTTHFEDVSPQWGERPDWLRVKASLSVDGGTASASTSATLASGTHAVICIRYWEDDSAMPVARLEVESVN
jgi:hypothetical protein